MADIKNWTSTRQIWNGVFTLPIPIPPVNQLFVMLKDGSTVDMSVDGSITAVSFQYIVPDGKVVFLTHAHILIIDGGITPTKFGGIAALTNGLLVQAIDTDGSTVIADFTGDHAIFKNSDWHLLGGSESETIAAAGDDVEEVSLSFSEESGPLLLTEGQCFRFLVQDDLSAITEMETMIEGDIFDDGIFND